MRRAAGGQPYFRMNTSDSYPPGQVLP